jgi:RNA polymerase sigma-70 factor (ECF subfamily)
MKDHGQGQGEIVKLVKASQAGDKVAFDRLVQLHQRQAMRVALNILGSVDDAADVVQDAFVKGYLRIASLKCPARFRVWMLRIVANEAISQQRAVRRRVTIARVFIRGGVRRRPKRPDEAEHTSDLKAAVEQAMLQLTEKEAKAIALFGLDDLPHREVARIMGCSTEAVRWHVYRARQKLRVLLKEYME